MTLRVLTVRQPWAWSLIEGGKDCENRVRNIAGSYRGPVAIHAGLARFEDDGLWPVRKAIKSLDLGYEASDSQVWAADHVESTDPRDGWARSDYGGSVLGGSPVDAMRLLDRTDPNRHTYRISTEEARALIETHTPQ